MKKFFTIFKRIFIFGLVAALLVTSCCTVFAKQSETRWLVANVQGLNFGQVYVKRVPETKRYVTITNKDSEPHTMTAAILDTDKVWVAEIPPCFDMQPGESITFAVCPYKANRAGLYGGAILIKEDGIEDTENTLVLNCSVLVTENASFVRNVYVYPQSQTVTPSGTCNFYASVVGGSNTNVIWSLEGNTSAKTSISPEGVLTVGEDETSAGLVVIAKAESDETKYNAASVLIDNTGKNTIAVACEPATAGIVAGQGVYEPNASVFLTAAPASGNQFEGWYENDTKVSDSPILNLEADGNRILVARFSGTNVINEEYTEPVPELSKVVSKEAGNALTFDETASLCAISSSKSSGYGSLYPSGRITVPEGNDKIYVLAPGRENVVDKVIVDGSDVGNRAMYGFDNVIENHTIDVTFRKRSEEALINRALLNYHLGINSEDTANIESELLTYIDGAIRDQGVDVNTAREIISRNEDLELLTQAYARGDLNVSVINEFSDNGFLAAKSLEESGCQVPAGFETAVFTPEERLKIYSGSRGIATLLIAKDNNEARKDELLADSLTKNVCEILNVSMLKAVSGTGAYVDAPMGDIEITLKLPAEIYSEGEEIYVARMVDNKPEKLEIQSQEGEYISFKTNCTGELLLCKGKEAASVEPHDVVGGEKTEVLETVSSNSRKNRPHMPAWYGVVSPGNGVVTDGDLKPNSTMFVYIIFMVILLPFVAYVIKRNRFETDEEDYDEDDSTEDTEEEAVNKKFSFKNFKLKNLKLNKIKFKKPKKITFRDIKNGFVAVIKFIRKLGDF